MDDRNFNVGDTIGVGELALLPTAEWEVDRCVWIGRSLHRSSGSLVGDELFEERRVIADSLEGCHLDGGRVVSVGSWGVEVVFQGRIGEVRIWTCTVARRGFPDEVLAGRGFEH